MSQTKGTYALLLQLEEPREITVGRLGRFVFPAGYYLYVGSALGPGGLEARLARHLARSHTSRIPLQLERRDRGVRPGDLRGKKRLRWHIDYLLECARLIEVWSVPSGERLECLWARAARELPGAQIPVPGFGASDCRCPAHLVHFATRPSLAPLRQPPPRLEWSDRL